MKNDNQRSKDAVTAKCEATAARADLARSPDATKEMQAAALSDPEQYVRNAAAYSPYLHPDLHKVALFHEDPECPVAGSS